MSISNIHPIHPSAFSPHPSERLLVERVASGDRAAINELYRLLQPQLRAAIRPILARASALNSWLDAEDMEQEAYPVFHCLVNRWLGMANARPPLAAYVTKWLPVYLGHRLRKMTHFRARAREIPLEGEAGEGLRSDEGEASPPGVSRRDWIGAISVDDVDEAVQVRELHRLLRLLSPIEQLVITLRYFQEWPISKVAQALSLPERRVQELHRAALEQVRRMFQGEEPAASSAPEGCSFAQVETYLRAAAAHPRRKLPSGRECPALGLPSRFPRLARPVLKRLGITQDDQANRPAHLSISLDEALEKLKDEG